MQKNKKRIRNSTRKVLMTVFLSLIIISIIVAIVSSSSKKITKDKEYSYKSSIVPTYTVNLKQNDYIKDKNMQMDKVYLRELTDSIDINFDYNYKGSKNTDINTSYNTKAILVVQTLKSGVKNTIFEKEYNLSNNSKNIKSSLENSFTETINIDIEKYNKIVEDFIGKYGISVNAYLNIVFEANSYSNFNNKDIQSNNKSTIKIDLLDKVYSIETNTNSMDANTLYNEQSHSSKTGYIISAILVIVAIIGIIYIKMYTKDMKLPPNNYKSEKYKILRDYGNRLAQIKTPIEETNKTIIELVDFEEIAKVADELWQPILYFDDEKSRKVFYYVVTDTIIYLYVLSD